MNKIVPEDTGKRLLMYHIESKNHRINEYTILEVSPTGEYFKYTINTIYQQSPLWCKTENYIVVERLVDKS